MIFSILGKKKENAFVLRDLSFETKNMWTVLDYLRHYCYVHLLDILPVLILITRTLEYDILLLYNRMLHSSNVNPNIYVKIYYHERKNKQNKKDFE